jgi:dihydrodipicolinate synthase/N-acetylneuraminate lyase
MMKRPLCGIIPPMVTPLRGRDELDVPGLERLIERLLSGGVSGLFLLGTTGEGPSLSYRLRRELVERSCRLARGRTPVLVCITDTAFVESVNLARHAADAGADALVVAAPYYMPEGQAELEEYLEHLVAALPLPLFLYNMPALTKVAFEVETVRRAMDEPRIIGIKDSSGDLNYFRAVAGLRDRRPDWSLLIGPEELLSDAIDAGGHGGVCGGANLFPTLYVKLCDAARAGDKIETQRLKTQVRRVGELLYHIGRHRSSLIKGIKCALACLGVCDDFMAEPFHRFRAEERRQVEQQLAVLNEELESFAVTP